MPDPVTIRYDRVDGPRTTVHLHRVGHEGSWVLDLLEVRDGELWAVHQHSIEGEPEVEVG